MQVANVLTKYRRDFTATMTCEHCEHEQYLGYGYNDHYFRDSVIPSIHCQACGKNRAGELPKVPA